MITVEKALRRNAPVVGQEAGQVSERAAEVAVAAEALGARDGRRVQHRDAPPPEPAHEIDILHQGDRREPAHGVVKRARNEKALVAIGQAEQPAAQRDGGFENAGAERRLSASRKRKAAAASSPFLMKACASSVHPLFERRVGMEEQAARALRAVAAPARNCWPRPRSHWMTVAPASSAILRVASVGAAVADDDFAHDPVDRRIEDRKERGRQVSWRR